MIRRPPRSTLATSSAASDVYKRQILEIPNFGSAMDRFNPDEAARVRWTFDGQEIFKSGVRAMAQASAEAIEKSGLSKEDVDIFIPHQANIRIVEALEKKLGLPNATTIKKVHRYGNTSAASIPTAFVDALEAVSYTHLTLPTTLQV